MQGLAQISAGRCLPAVVIVACAINGCAQSVPVGTVQSAGAATGSTVTSNTDPSVSTTPVATPTNAALALQGSPATSVVAGTAYAFQPSTSASTTAVTFTIVNQPAWAVFSPATGELDGTPPLSSLGTTANITITASNGSSAATIGPFDITVTAPPPSPTPSPVGTATLTWTAPTLNSDGTPLTDLAGYHIYYGTNAAQLGLQVILNGAASTTYVVNGLAIDTYYFAVTAFNSKGIESEPSNEVSKTF